MTRGLFAGLAVVAVLASLLGGCGGGDSSTSEALSKQQFVKQGNAICANAEAKKNAELQAALEARGKSGKPLTKSFETELVTTVALPPVVAMTEELADLGEPKTEAEDAAAMVAAYEDGVKSIEAEPSSVLDGSNPFETADKLAAEYGLKTCSEI